jgi:hypothetical protein
LVNVQWKPIDKETPGKPYTGEDAATYYLADIVIETDYNLQKFSGTFQDSLQAPYEKTKVNGLITDFNSDGTPTKNVYHKGKGSNMGGCMGCHGFIATKVGSDFSFLLDDGSLNAPESGGKVVETDARVMRFLKLYLRD